MGFMVHLFALALSSSQVSHAHSQDLPNPTNISGDFQIHCKHSRKVILSEKDVKLARNATAGQPMAFDKFVGFEETIYIARSGSHILSRSDRRETQNSYRAQVFRDSKTFDSSVRILRNESAFEFERRALETFGAHQRSETSIQVRKIPSEAAFRNLPPLPISIDNEKMFDVADTRFEQFRNKMKIGKEWIACGVPFESRQKMLPWSPTPGFVSEFARKDIFSPRKAVFYNPSHPVCEIIYDRWKQTQLGFLPTKITVIDHELGEEENIDPLIDRKVVARDVYEDIKYSVLKPKRDIESVSDFLVDGMFVNDEFTNPGQFYSLKKSEWAYGNPFVDPDKSSAKIKE